MQLNGHISSWAEARSSVLQRYILGPLFTIFFDEIVDEVLCKISKFAEDTKIAS